MGLTQEEKKKVREKITDEIGKAYGTMVVVGLVDSLYELVTELTEYTAGQCKGCGKEL